ncbi:fimbrial protein [Scandinavium goeteborgense]|uniref:Type 1 fimbria pilin n=1 Tax=Scandinavium goeteborgense TaxID=1851514 RepID=A0A4V3BPQ5_SCAGO|nr:fimbrial protein [Scandinavium goeteborgense]TDN59567.1 type 1 fimbria pilin [Scandinavium goeteborgense]
MNSFIGYLKKLGSKNMGLRSLLAVLLLSCGVHNAMAGVCTYLSTQPQITVNQSFTAQQDSPVGMTLSTATYNQQYKVAENCSGDYKFSRLANTSTYPTAGNNTTFKSGVEGVGIKVTIGPYELSTINFMNGANGDGTSPVYIQDIKVEFVKTGTITPGRMTAGKIGTVQIYDEAGVKAVLTINIGSVDVKQASCEITGSSAIPVPMGKVMKEDFQGKNSTLSSQDINIPLQCSAGTRVNINFDALSSFGNGIIDLTAGGAEGVGIQLKLNSIPVEFNKTLFVAEATQQGAFAIPLKAAYIQTADTIKTGLVNAVANFTVTYQ